MFTLLAHSRGSLGIPLFSSRAITLNVLSESTKTERERRDKVETIGLKPLILSTLYETGERKYIFLQLLFICKLIVPGRRFFPTDFVDKMSRFYQSPSGPIIYYHYSLCTLSLSTGTLFAMVLNNKHKG
jgi:hypothetical protein